MQIIYVPFISCVRLIWGIASCQLFTRDQTFHIPMWICWLVQLILLAGVQTAQCLRLPPYNWSSEISLIPLGMQNTRYLEYCVAGEYSIIHVQHVALIAFFLLQGILLLYCQLFKYYCNVGDVIFIWEEMLELYVRNTLVEILNIAI